jgi:hypothetical protein
LEKTDCHGLTTLPKSVDRRAEVAVQLSEAVQSLSQTRVSLLKLKYSCFKARRWVKSHLAGGIVLRLFGSVAGRSWVEWLAVVHEKRT